MPSNGVAVDAGGSGSDSGGGGGGIAIAARDDRFDPACVRLDHPGTVTLVVRNDGRHPHNLTIDERHRTAVDSGQVGIVEAAVGVDGLRFVCTLHPGMEGELRVQP